MTKARRVDTTLRLSCLCLIAACGSSSSSTPDTSQNELPSKSVMTMPETMPMMMMDAAGSSGLPKVMRALAMIEPLMLPPPADTGAAGMSGATTMTAASAGMGAAGAGAAGMGSSMAAAGTGMGGAGAGAGGSGTGMGSGYAAGSGGSTSDMSTAAAGTGAATMGASGAGTAGMGAAGTGAAGMSSAATGGSGGAPAMASISGTATFSSTPSGVNLTVMVSGCVDGKEYPIHIHQGMSCASAMAQGGHWDMTRGEGIANITCGGKQGFTMEMRANTDSKTAWSVGDGSPSDVVGHVVVIHDADNPKQRIACGQILKL